ncbi:DUF3927 family protein [Klebsiella pneumoniae]|uniref:DUF3927 family protein n=1 Tax=Klebsiella pneumoniae TaxID=573 RepID=UPI00296E9136|nr:DUF3927 family protein [Klebsiella pneumoniae]MDW3810579.1 DUF3927 family protein [Klebsiella pneumoniae]
MARVSIALALLMLSVLVDFTSRIMSVAADGVLVITGLVILMPILIKGIKLNKGLRPLF